MYDGFGGKLSPVFFLSHSILSRRRKFSFSFFHFCLAEKCGGNGSLGKKDNFLSEQFEYRLKIYIYYLYLTLFIRKIM